MVVDEFQETISFRQSKWLQKTIHFNTPKNEAEKDSRRDFYILLNNTF